MNQERIGKLIKEIRKDNNLTQKDLAKKLGVTYQAVSKWETGKNIPDIAILKKISEEYNIDLDDILEGKKKHKKKDKKKYILPIVLIILLVISFGSIFLRNNDTLEFKKITTNNNNFKVTGSIANSKGKTYIYITDISYEGIDDETTYETITSTLYEKYKNTNVEIKQSATPGKNITLKEHLAKVKFNIDNYKLNCEELEDSKFYIEVKATNKNDKVTTYKIDLQLEEICLE